MNEPTAAAVAWSATCAMVAVIVIALCTYTTVASQRPFYRDTVYEYATNRLCQISAAECERLAHVIQKAERDDRPEPTTSNAR